MGRSSKASYAEPPPGQRGQRGRKDPFHKLFMGRALLIELVSVSNSLCARTATSFEQTYHSFIPHPRWSLATTDLRSARSASSTSSSTKGTSPQHQQRSWFSRSRKETMEIVIVDALPARVPHIQHRRDPYHIVLVPTKRTC